MVKLKNEHVERVLIETINKINVKLKINAAVSSETCPGSIIRSQILITIISRIGTELGVIIPNSCYLFHDKKSKRQLSISEAAQKLIKEAKNGN